MPIDGTINHFERWPRWIIDVKARLIHLDYQLKWAIEIFSMWYPHLFIWRQITSALLAAWILHQQTLLNRQIICRSLNNAFIKCFRCAIDTQSHTLEIGNKTSPAFHCFKGSSHRYIHIITTDKFAFEKKNARVNEMWFHRPMTLL